MIVSHRHKFVFFAVPRTATHAVRAVLTPILGPNDWQQQQLFGKQTLPHPKLAAIGHGHITLQQLMQILDDDRATIAGVDVQQISRFTRFAVVRNPFDRFVSVCAMLNKNNPDFTQNPSVWMLRAFDRAQFRQRILVRPQVDMLIDEQSELNVSVLGRYETLQASLDEFGRAVGIEIAPLPAKNASSRGEWQAYYDKALAERVAEFYSRDFDLLNYSPELTSYA